MVDNVLLYGVDHGGSTFSICLKNCLEIVIDGEHGCLIVSFSPCSEFVVENASLQCIK